MSKPVVYVPVSGGIAEVILVVGDAQVISVDWDTVKESMDYSVDDLRDTLDELVAIKAQADNDLARELLGRECELMAEVIDARTGDE